MAGIGPSIGACCFEVDEPVASVFAAMGEGAGCIRERGAGKYVDLWEVNRRVLAGAGIEPEHISVAGLCTRCHPDIFWSHRAAGALRGSLAAFIAIATDRGAGECLHGIADMALYFLYSFFWAGRRRRSVLHQGGGSSTVALNGQPRPIYGCGALLIFHLSAPDQAGIASPFLAVPLVFLCGAVIASRRWNMSLHG